MSGSCPLHLGESLQNAETFNWLCLSSAQCWLSPRSAMGVLSSQLTQMSMYSSLNRTCFRAITLTAKILTCQMGSSQQRRGSPKPTDAMRVENKECWYEGCFWEEGRRYEFTAMIQLSMSHGTSTPSLFEPFPRMGTMYTDVYTVGIS